MSQRKASQGLATAERSIARHTQVAESKEPVVNSLFCYSN